MSLLREQVLLKEITPEDGYRHLPSSRDAKGRIRCPYCVDQTIEELRGGGGYTYQCPQCETVYVYGVRYGKTPREARAEIVRQRQERLVDQSRNAQ